jgi:hypothetical protein
VSAHIVKKTREVGGASCENAKERIVADRRYHGISVLLLDYCHFHIASLRARSDFIGCGNYSGHACCQTFCVELERTLAIDQQSVASQNYDCFDAGSLANGDSKVAYCRHQRSNMNEISRDIAGNLPS